jgi:hypothetical protein
MLAVTGEGASAMHRIVCFANSTKLGGHCVAGRVIASSGPGVWIRPVSDRPNEELSPHERCYADAIEPVVLDVVELGLLEHRPHLHQRENWLIDPSRRWRRLGTLRAEPAVLDPFLSPDAELWSGGIDSARGISDRVTLEQAQLSGESLRFICVASAYLVIQHVNDSWESRIAFEYGGVDYNLAVTDPTYTAPRDGPTMTRVELGRSYLTVSLGKPFHGFCYKLVAAIVEAP